MPRRARTIRAYGTARSYRGQTPSITQYPTLANHPVLKVKPIEVYENPAQTGGWAYVLEPLLGSWIGFVDVFGNGLLWLDREPDGGVIGNPFSFRRPDLNIVGRLLAKTVRTCPL